ncbi:MULTISPECIES: type II toxin-antitoxin system VapC family toxin [Halomonas]|uniref:PIN domain-containing protein n=1 Tax=Halomonas flagellata TaxID=2920385 RepID=A0ABS9RY03_9GAMM|nr:MULTISPECIES: PIN domain-containing protein [Halomonas]MCH4564725.1 PIN domain-containing protein [Halomonas flagellata]PXX99298.1 pilus assembly protein [Halomonas sp. LBP4]
MILVDTNVLLDVIQKREPHYPASAAVIDGILRHRYRGTLSAHAVTTIHFLVHRYQNGDLAHQAVAWLLRHFDIASVGRAELWRAQGLGWADFEDAVVAAAAETRGCHTIVTRNVRDFAGSPVPAMTPEEYLLSVPSAEGPPLDS